MDTGHSIGDALIVAAIAAAVVAYLFIKHRERQRRLEIVHEERMAAMQKDIPLPELRFDEPAPKAEDPREMLLHGIVWMAFGLGGMITLFVIGSQSNMPALWSLPLPLALLGGGLTLYYLAGRTR